MSEAARIILGGAQLAYGKQDPFGGSYLGAGIAQGLSSLGEGIYKESVRAHEQAKIDHDDKLIKEALDTLSVQSEYVRHLPELIGKLKSPQGVAKMTTVFEGLMTADREARLEQSEKDRLKLEEASGQREQERLDAYLAQLEEQRKKWGRETKKEGRSLRVTRQAGAAISQALEEGADVTSREFLTKVIQKVKPGANHGEIVALLPRLVGEYQRSVDVDFSPAATGTTPQTFSDGALAELSKKTGYSTEALKSLTPQQLTQVLTQIEARKTQEVRITAQVEQARLKREANADYREYLKSLNLTKTEMDLVTTMKQRLDTLRESAKQIQAKLVMGRELTPVEQDLVDRYQQALLDFDKKTGEISNRIGERLKNPENFEGEEKKPPVDEATDDAYRRALKAGGWSDLPGGK